MDTATERPYTVILWLGDSYKKDPARFPVLLQRLKEMGVNTGMVTGDEDPTRFVAAKLPYYVENIVSRGLCLKWNAAVKDWDAFVTRWAKEGRPEAAFVREYCLDDPGWKREAQSRVEAAARVHKPNKPELYDLRDELSVTISANPFDYDFSPASLAAFREWLKKQYPTLDALNAQWYTKFARWDDVKPFSTDRIKNRMASGDAEPRGNPDWGVLQTVQFDPAEAKRAPTHWNFSPWCDFRTYMDVALARTLGNLRDSLKAVDSQAKVGIEGTQMPSAFGGYDLARLATALDWVEPYDIGCAREIWGSFMSGKPQLTTVGEQDARAAQRRLWHLRLLGDTGCILWWSEDCIDFGKPDWPLTPRGKALAPVLKELQGPLAQRFGKAVRELDPIYIHYSQPSIQIAWLLESTVDGSTWQRRYSSYEAENNRHARIRAAWLAAFQDLGYTPQFSATLDTLPPGSTVVLPHSYALTERERQALGRLPRILSSGPIGTFDGHGKLIDAPTPATRSFSSEVGDYSAARLKPTPDTAFPGWLAQQLPPPPVRVRAADRVRVHRFREGKTRLLAFERGISYQMSESLQQAGGNGVLEVPIEVVATLDRPSIVTDLWTGKKLGRKRELRFTLDPWRPSLFSVE